MSVDRILQLKLIADVGNIRSQMSGVEKDVGKVNRAFNTLKGFAIPAMIGLGSTITTNVVGALSDATAEAGELRRALDNLDTLADALGLDEGAQAALEALTAEAATLGFGDQVAIAESFTRAVAVTEDLATAADLVRAGFDLARASGEDLGEAGKEAMDQIIGGGDEAEEKFGIIGDTLDERMASFNAKYGNFAEDFALTDEGQWQSIEAQFEGHMLNLGGLLDQWILDTKAALVKMFGDWEYIFEEGPRILGTALDQMAGQVGEAFANMRALVVGGINAVIGAWNALDPSIDISIHEGFEFMGQRVGLDFDFHSGDLIPDIPYVGLQHGGIVTGPTLALIGEGMHDEAVIPLDGRGMGNTYNVTVHATASSPADTGRAVVEAIEAFERRSGSGWRD